MEKPSISTTLVLHFISMWLALTIFQVPACRLVTSYEIPPQATFTCPPYSVRWRALSSRTVARYTYSCTRQNHHTQRLSLYKDIVDQSGRTTSKAITHDVVSHYSNIFISPSTCPQDSPLDGDISPPDIITVSEVGEITSLNGESLQENWQTRPQLLSQDMEVPNKGSLRVELAVIIPSSEVISGLFSGKRHAYSVFSQPIEARGFNPDTLLIITTVLGTHPRVYHIHLLAIIPREMHAAYQQKIFLLRSAKLPKPKEGTGLSSFRVDVRCGSLLWMSGETLSVINIQENVARIRSEMTIPGVTSVLHLSKSSSIVLTADSLSIYNTMYESIQAKVKLETPGQGGSLISYFPRQQVLLLLLDGGLVVAQLESPKSQGSKRRAEGQLLDAYGRGIRRREIAMSGHLPSFRINSQIGTLEPGYWEKLDSDRKKADKCLEEDDILGLEKILAAKFGMTRMSLEEPANDGMNDRGKGMVSTSWNWPKSRFQYQSVDRTWVLYAMRIAFQWVEKVVDGFPETRLDCLLVDSNVVNYLVYAGHLSLENVKEAFREDSLVMSLTDIQIIEALVHQLASLDPRFEILVNYLSSTRTDAPEILCVLRAMMTKIDRRSPISTSLLPNPDPNSKDESKDEADMELDYLGAELKIGQEQLESNWDILSSGLNLSLSKLCHCGSERTVQALRLLFKPSQILSLIVLLRTQLVKDGWTSLYIGNPEFDEEKNPDYFPPSDDSIRVISEVLSRCVDAMGQGGWLANDSELAKNGQDSGGFINNLKLEVSVALEGAESASYLLGLVNEVLKYGERAGHMYVPGGSKKPNNKPITIERGGGLSELPLGLKAEERISSQKVNYGGEVKKRRRREVGHLVSQRVAPYSLERIIL